MKKQEEEQKTPKILSSYQEWLMHWKRQISFSSVVEEYKRQDERKGWFPMQAVIK